MFRGLVSAVAAAAIVGLIAVGLAGGQQSAEAQQTASATRSFSPVEAGGQLVVTIAVDGYGGIGQLTEDVPGRLHLRVVARGDGVRPDRDLQPRGRYVRELHAHGTHHQRDKVRLLGNPCAGARRRSDGRRPFLGDRLVPPGTADSVGHQVVLPSGGWWPVGRDDSR